VAYITAALVLTPKLGAASFIISVIAGQMLASLLIDHFGLMGLAPKPAGVGRVAGVVLILLGMVIVQMSSSTPLPALQAGFNGGHPGIEADDALKISEQTEI
jgi:transporter family-2 protein